MNDSGLWKRGLVMLVLVAIIAGAALWVALRRPAPVVNAAEPICPELLAQMLCSPATVAVAPFPTPINWGVLYQLSQTSPSPRGWEVRYNAALALARKGHLEKPNHFDTLCEMLDQRQQSVNFSACQKNGKMAADEGAAVRAVYNALQAVAQWYQHPDRLTKFVAENAELKREYDAGLAKLTQAVTQLTQSPNQVLHTEALKTLQVLQGK